MRMFVKAVFQTLSQILIDFKSILLLFLIFSSTMHSQHLQPGFDKHEYLDLMKISICTAKDSFSICNPDRSKLYRKLYRSKNLGLDNAWDLWQNGNTKAVISLRGTTKNPESWLENFYAAMVPATGTLYLKKNVPFQYKLAENPKAAVHVGWLVGMAFLAEEIVPKIKELSCSGIEEYYIIGHSQGGAIAYLLTAYLLHLQKNGDLSSSIKLKTYCSAAPKPGNLYFAYDYESLTQNGWSFNIINPLDWVPETPFSIQTLTDFNRVNPFTTMKKSIKKQGFPKNLLFRYVFNRMEKPTRKAQKNYKKFLGEVTHKQVTNYVKELKVPEYQSTNNYVRTGTSIILPVDDMYTQKFIAAEDQFFVHHTHESYIWLAVRLSLSNESSEIVYENNHEK